MINVCDILTAQHFHMYGKSSTLVLNYYKPAWLGGLSNFLSNLSKAARSLNGLTTRLLEASLLTFAALPFS